MRLWEGDCGVKTWRWSEACLWLSGEDFPGRGELCPCAETVVGEPEAGRRSRWLRQPVGLGDMRE